MAKETIKRKVEYFNTLINKNPIPKNSQIYKVTNNKHKQNKQLCLLNMDLLVSSIKTGIKFTVCKDYLLSIHNHNLKINAFNQALNRLKNLKYDLKNKSYYYDSKGLSKKALFEKDKNQYDIINKQINYKDISIYQILKILQHNHKITKAQYKNTIKRIQKGKPPQNNIRGRIQCYYNTFKSRTANTSLKALQDKASNRNTRHLRLHYKKQLYKVTVKKRLSYFSFKALNNEFEKRLNSSNIPLFSESDNLSHKV